MDSINSKDCRFSLYSDACDYVIDKLSKRKVDLSTRHIVITPKAYTLFFEQRLSNGGGFFDIEVLSLSRLYYKLGGKPLLPDESAVMEIKRILKNIELKSFNKSKGFAGFSQRMLETINRLADSGISPDSLDESNLKLADVKRVYTEYIKRNPYNMAQMILSLINKSGYFNNAHVYVVNFDNLTRLESRIFDMIEPLALSFTYAAVESSPMDKLQLPKTEVYSALNRAEELKAAARRIKKAVRQGIKLNEMCVVCAPESYETAKRIFNEYEIDFYCDKRQSLAANPLSQYVLSVLKASASRHDCLKFIKNPYSNISAADGARFENYCYKYNIEYNLSKPFELGADFERDVPERIREHAYAKLSLFKHNRGIGYLKDFIESMQAHDGDEAAKTRLKEILSLINETDIDYKELFCEAVQSARLRPLPSGGGLSVSSAASNRGKRFKIAFILDFNEGVMPSSLTDLGIIGARESSALQLSPSLEHINQRNRDDITELIYSSESVFLSYVRSPSDRPSPLLYALKDRAKNWREISSTAEHGQIDSCTDYQILADYAACKNGGLEQLLLTLNRPTVFSSSLYAALKDEADRMISRASYFPKTVKGEIFDISTVSASRLQTYFDCPYKHFIRYGLKAKESEKGGLSPLDTGLLIHKAAEKFFLCNFDESRLDGIIETAIKDFMYKLDTSTALRLADEIKRLCVHLKNNLKSGKFTPLGAELRLSDPRFKAVYINGALLSGSIDYADTHNGYARVIDYKSGLNVSYENKTLYYGLKLQLPLYMYALNQNGYKSAAMFYFPFRLKWNCGSYPFIGVFDSSPEIVYAMDNTLANDDSDAKAESCVIPASIKYTKEGIRVTGSVAKTQNEFKELTEYAYLLSFLAVKQIKEGFIEPLPYKNSSRTSCHNCAYKIACGFCGSLRVLRAIKKQGGGDENE